MAKNNKQHKLTLLLVFLAILILIGFWGILKMYHIQDADEIQPAAATAPAEQAVPEFDRNDKKLILVNKTHRLDPDYEPEELVKFDNFAEDRMESLWYMDPEAGNAFQALTDAAAAQGFQIKGTSGYRSYDYQKILHDYYVKTKGQEWTDRYSAEAGASEHHTGLAVDISCASLNYELTLDFAKTDEGKWVADHAHEYGYILRYQKDKEDITGYAYEPWHIRYVGRDAAKVIYEEGLVFEEFVEKYCK